MAEDDPVPYPIDGTLDLHMFRPQEVAEVTRDYLQLCREQGILDVRVVHGKGIGTLRETVHALLRKMPEVESFSLGDAGSGGGWGATLVRLKAK